MTLKFLKVESLRYERRLVQQRERGIASQSVSLNLAISEGDDLKLPGKLDSNLILAGSVLVSGSELLLL
jgi:hypothetical protein